MSSILIRVLVGNIIGVLRIEIDYLLFKGLINNSSVEIIIYITVLENRIFNFII